ncbi:ATP phosphoribosyltransferase regulatory subunit, partial [Chloroflexota bacterium]
SEIKEKKPELERALSLLLDVKGDSSGFLRNLKALFNRSLPEFEPRIDDFINVVDLLEAMNYKYQIDITSGRGFEYYTGVIFQFFHNGDKLGGGGRYDDLIPLLGQGDIPASGFALYLDPLMNLLESENNAKQKVLKILVRTKPADVEAIKQGFAIASSLREAGYKVGLGLGGEQLSEQNWLLDVNSETPHFTLTNHFNNSQCQAESVNEVLSLLGEQGANKDSAT